MESVKSKKIRSLTLEERHTKSLAASKEIRLRYQQSIFIPRERYHRYTPKEMKRARTKHENSQNQEKLSKKLTCAKTMESHKNKFSQNTGKCSTVAAENSEKSTSTRDKKTHPNTSITVNILNPAEAKTSNSPDSVIRVTDSDVLIEDAPKTKALLNLPKEYVKAPISENHSNHLKESNLLARVIAETATCPQTKINNLTIRETVISPPIATQSPAAKEFCSAAQPKESPCYDNLFETDFQNVIRYLIPTTKDCSPLVLQISRDLHILDNCAKSFSQYIWQIHKDLDDKERETQSRIEYARKRDAEREKSLHLEGSATFCSSPSTTTAEIPETFTIYIEADNFPKKSITFETSDFHDAHVGTANTAGGEISPNGGAAPKYPVLRSNTSTPNRSHNEKKANTPVKAASRKKTGQNLKQVRRKIRPTRTKSLNIKIPTQTSSITAANSFNCHLSHNTPHQMYNNGYAAPNYYNCWPETNLFNNSWITADEQCRKSICQPQFQSFHTEPTIEMTNWDFGGYQCHNSLQPIPFMENRSLHPIIEPNVCSTSMPNCLPTYPDIQLRKY